MRLPAKMLLAGIAMLFLFAPAGGCQTPNLSTVQPSVPAVTPQQPELKEPEPSIIPTEFDEPEPSVEPPQPTESGMAVPPTESPQPSQTPLPVQAPAFPEAEGFGAKSIGGRGGRVIEVNNLNDSGPGSLRAAVEEEGPRIVVFRVGGMIELKSSIEITNPYITIAGQTAPGGGITLTNHPSNHESPLVIKTHDVILRYIRSRPGAPDQPSENGDAIEIHGGAYNVIVDHCSFSWAIDEVASIWYDAHDITIQWSIISEGLYCSRHVKGCHSMGLLVGSEGANNISIHHNLFAHNHQRNPLIQTSGLVEIVNNVIYNSWGSPVLFSDEFGKVWANVIGNYQVDGPDSEDGKYFLSVQIVEGNGPAIFVEGNITPQRTLDTFEQTLVVKPNSLDWIVADRIETGNISVQPASLAYEQVLAKAGATVELDQAGNIVQRRDDVDRRIIEDVIDGTGHIIDDPSQVGGWPKLDFGTPPIDSDHDGMPDLWELQFRLDPTTARDGPQDADGDGYTNIEEYLNATDPWDYEE